MIKYYPTYKGGLFYNPFFSTPEAAWEYINSRPKFSLSKEDYGVSKVVPLVREEVVTTTTVWKEAE